MGYNSTLRSANYVVGLFLASLVILIHPKSSKVGLFSSRVFLIFCPLIMIGGGYLEFKEIKNLPEAILASGGISYGYEEDYDSQEAIIANFSKLVAEGGVQIDWKESLWYWYHGCNSCTCGNGFPLRLKKNRQLISVKHEHFQLYGFLAFENKNILEFQRVLWEENETLQKELELLRKNLNNHNQTFGQIIGTARQ